MNTNTMLQKLQDKLAKKYNEMFGPTFSTMDTDTLGADEDPSSVDTPYTTNVAVKLPTGTKHGNTRVSEAEKEEEVEKFEKTSTDKEEPTNDTNDMPEDPTMNEPVDGGMNQDPTMGNVGMNGDVGMSGMGGMEQEEELTSTEIGRIYELKKIYSRLTSIESYLANESSQELLEIRSYVSQGIELFEIVSSNFKSYKEKLDEIIVTYYKFLIEVYKNVEEFYSKHSKNGDN